MHTRQGYKRRRPDSRSVLLHRVVFSGGVCLSAASERDSWIACATAAFRAVVRPDQVPLRGATTSIALIFRFPVGFNWWQCTMFCFGRPSVEVGVVSVWIAGGLRVSSRLVSFRLGNASSRGIWEIGCPGSSVAMSCREIDGRCCCSALSTIPGKEQRIPETETQAGRAAETIGGHSMQAVRGGRSTRRK